MGQDGLEQDGKRTDAESRFLEYLGQCSGETDADFGAFCAQHPDLTDDLAVLHDRWRSIAPLLRSGVSADDFASSLQDILDSVVMEEPESLSASPDVTLQVDADQTGVGQSPQEILARLADPTRLENRYQSADEIARGGMGIVYRVRDEDLRRDLAMKVVLPRPAAPGENGSNGSTSATPASRPGAVEPDDTHSEAAMARFLEEAFVTAQLDHPGIVPVHELGIDADGRVYFTMKLVKGRHLKRIFDLVHAGEEGWTLNRAVGVILRVCEAVAYAHSKGVLHRDIKPMNIMVGRYGETYLMDWGLARVVGSPLQADTIALEQLVEQPPPPPTDEPAAADSWLFSLDGKVLGTPMYMSPEQARGEIDRVDERSDIYSLGAVLYHLLTGRMPYVGPDELPLPYTTLMRVRKGPPAPLSERAPDAPPTLLAICNQAMARSIGDRFATASEMASALEDYLEDISEAREEARRQARRAETINEFLMTTLTSGDPNQAQGRDVTVREVLDVAARRIRTAFPEQPLDEAALRHTIGNIYRNLDHLAEAEPHLAGAVELMRQTVGRGDPQTLSAAADLAVLYRMRGRTEEAEMLITDTLERQTLQLGEQHPDTLRSLAILASIARMAGARVDEAEALYRRSLQGRRAVLGEDHPDTLRVKNSLALLLDERDETVEALALQREVYAANRRLYGISHPQSLMSSTDLANMLQATGALDEAEELYRETLTAERQVFGDEHATVLTSLNNLGMLLLRAGKLEESEQLLTEAATTHARRFGAEHAHSLSFSQNLALVIQAQGRPAEAEERLRDVVQKADEHLDAGHQITARFRSNLARCLIDQGRLKEAAALLAPAAEALASALGEQHAWTREAREQLADLARTEEAD